MPVKKFCSGPRSSQQAASNSQVLRQRDVDVPLVPFDVPLVPFDEPLVPLDEPAEPTASGSQV